MFQPNDIFPSQSQGFQVTTGLNFVPQPSQQHSRYSLDVNAQNAERIQELFVERDENGDIRAASYDSGARVRRHDAYTMVKAANNSLWMGDRFGAWHPLD